VNPSALNSTPFNPYAIPPIITAILLFGLSFFVYTKNPRSNVHRTFGLFCLSMVLWLLGFCAMYVSRDPTKALRWARVGFMGIALIPAFEYHFILTFLRLRQPKTLALLYGIGIAGLFLAWTPLVYKDIWRGFWGYYPSAGLLYPIFPISFSSAFMAGIWFLYRALKVEKNPLRRQQIGYLLIAFATGIPGVIDYIVKYKIHIYPFGYIDAFLFLSITGYAIARHRLMDVNLAITRTTVFMVVYALGLGLPLFMALSFESQLARSMGPHWWVWLWVVCALLATAAHYANIYFQRFAENRFLAEQRRYQATLRRASEGMTKIRQLPRLLKLTVGILSRAVGLTHVSIYLFDEETKRYGQRVSKGKDGHPTGVGLELGDPLIRHLTLHKSAVVMEELHMQRQQADDPGLHDVEMVMHRLGAALVIPSFVHDHLLGFVIMGAKRSGKMYTDDDLKVLMTLANQAALAIENARFYETEKERQAEMFHTAQLASLGTMAGSMSHQINNRFYVESVVAGAQRTLWQEVDLTGVPEHVRELAQKTIVAFQKIETDAIRGGDIAKTLLNFSKPGKMDRTTFPEIIKLAMDLAQYRVKFEEIDFESVVSNPSPPLEGNKNQLTEVFYNLMSNAYDAIKSKEQKVKEGQLTVLAGQGFKGKLAVSATSAAKNGASWLQVVVHDNGIGVKQEDLTRLFIPFFTTKATAEKGTGLGLYVIKKIIENHGGKVEVNSAYGEGTTFTIHLPAAAGTA